MRVVIQRVGHASVTINGTCKSAIGKGLLILVGIEETDGQEDIDWLCKKIVNLRVFDDENGVMNKSILDINGETLVIEELHLEHLPIQIECFDNSNIQGSDPVAACVVFKKAKPSKQDYRKYNIKTVVGADDYASMKEVVRRRYQRAIEEKATLPDLLITDGGKGQMGAVKEVLDELNLNIPIAGLAKDGKHRTSELLYGFPPQTIGLKQNTPLFRLLTQIQDEVHRFAITFHREKRSKRQIASELDEIKGIGEKTKAALLKEFKSVKRIKEASLEALTKVTGAAKAKVIEEYFRS